MDFMDASLGAIVNKLKQKNLYEDTLIIVNSKHGQTPMDPIAFKEVDPKVFAAALAVPTFHTTVLRTSCSANRDPSLTVSIVR
jgi:arylsulfatase A-like enzyme